MYQKTTSRISVFFSGNEIDTSALSIDTWYKLTAVKDGATMRFYLNATSQGTTTLGTVAYTENLYSIGADAQSAFSVNSNLTMDIVRNRASALSANWITTEYNNQNDEAAFWGTWTTFGGGPAAVNARRLVLMMM
jgi:hypothetical protein